MKLEELRGYDLGERSVSYEERDAILYALTVGATAEQLDLVYERDLCVLPTYGLVLGLWVVEAAGNLGVYDRTSSLHVGQTLRVKAPLPKADTIMTAGRIVSVWDKGKAAMVEVEMDSEYLTARYSVFLPGLGSWGGARGPSTGEPAEALSPTWHGRYTTSPDHAVLYRLTGDFHPVHIDPEVARANGLKGPILHGLCTLGIAAREVASAVGAHACDLKTLEARFASPVTPGDAIEISAQAASPGEVAFEAAVGETVVLKSGRAAFSGQETSESTPHVQQSDQDGFQ